MYILYLIDSLDGYRYTKLASKSVELLKAHAESFIKARRGEIVWEYYENTESFSGYFNQRLIFTIDKIEYLEEPK